MTDVSPTGFLALPMHLRPTILLDSARLGRQTRALLRAATGGMYVPKGGEFLDLGCCRAIYCDQDDLDGDLGEGVLNVSLFPPAATVPVFDKVAEEKLAAEFQPQLLRYRCTNLRKVAASTFDEPGFTTGVRDLARSLGASVIGDATLTADIVSLLSARDSDLRANLAMRPDYAIVVSILSLIHERTQTRISVTMLTGFVNAVLRAGGEIKEYSPVEVGRLLSRLNVPRIRIAGGMVVELTRDVSRRVHELKLRYGVSTSPAIFPGCPDCEPEAVAADRQLM